MKIAVHHYDNECSICNAKGTRCAMMEDLEDGYFTNVCRDCEIKGDEYCRKKLENKN